MKRLAPILFTAVSWTALAQPAPVSVLFVGNSYTFGRLDPVLTYNAANVRDLTQPQGPLVVGSNSSTPKFSDVTGTNSYGPGMNNPTTGLQGNSYSPHSQTNGWGGVPGIFKQFTLQAGLNYDVALSTRNAATLRGHFLNTANSTNWDLRGNISSQKWDKMVLQEQSDEALGPQTVNGVPLGSNFPSIRAYVDLIEDWVHTGRPIQDGVMTNNLNDTTYRERNMYYLGGTTAAGGAGGQYANEAACVAAGGTPTVGATSGSCANNAVRTIPNNTNFSDLTDIYLQQTWARPNLINSPGTPTIDAATGNATYDTTKPVPSYFSTLEAMTTDMTTGMLNVAKFAADDGTSGIKGIIPVGQAFLNAVQVGVATRDMYAPDALTDGLIDLWFNDGTHASVAGSYLSALVLFQSLTGRNALSLGAGEQAAADLGIAPDVAVQLQRVAQATVGPDLSAPTTVAAANLPANANGWNNADVTVSLTATDNVNGSGVRKIAFATTGAQVGVGSSNADSASLTISVEGTTTVTYAATDNAGNVEAARTLVVQLDKTPPSLSGMPTGCEIWPPNNKLVIVATIAAQGGPSGLSSFSTDVASSEPAPPGQSDTVTTGTGLDPRTTSVRASRLGNGPGRTYTLSASATDRAGNATTATATCVVPHDKGN